MTGPMEKFGRPGITLMACSGTGDGTARARPPRSRRRRPRRRSGPPRTGSRTSAASRARMRRARRRSPSRSSDARRSSGSTRGSSRSRPSSSRRTRPRHADGRRAHRRRGRRPRSARGSSPRYSWSGAASSSGLAKTNGPHVSTWTGTSPRPSGSKPGSRSERGAFRSVPSRLYVHAWYGHCSVSRRPSPRQTIEPRWRQTLTNPRSTPSPSRTSTTGTLPTRVVAYDPGSDTCPVWPAYCQNRAEDPLPLALEHGGIRVPAPRERPLGRERRHARTLVSRPVARAARAARACRRAEGHARAAPRVRPRRSPPTAR